MLRKYGDVVFGRDKGSAGKASADAMKVLNEMLKHMKNPPKQQTEHEAYMTKFDEALGLTAAIKVAVDAEQNKARAESRPIPMHATVRQDFLIKRFNDLDDATKALIRAEIKVDHEKALEKHERTLSPNTKTPQECAE